MSVQEFGVKGYLGVILSNCLNMLTLCLHYLIDFNETWRPEVLLGCSRIFNWR